MPFRDREHAITAGRKGGLRTRQRLEQDPDYYQRIGTRGGEAIKRTRGREYYSTIGKMPRKGTQP